MVELVIFANRELPNPMMDTLWCQLGLLHIRQLSNNIGVHAIHVL
jgi:hypothetical protein